MEVTINGVKQMTKEEIKKHKMAIFEAVLDGKGIEHITSALRWEPCHEWSVLSAIRFDTNDGARFRIKPEPRVCWVGWGNREDTYAGPYCFDREEEKKEFAARFPNIKWQRVTEDVG